LTACGEEVPELLMSLFEVYLRASDDSFVEYIRIRQYSHIDGSSPLTSDKLMALALAQYEYYLDQGTWNTPTKKDKKIIALTTEIVNYGRFIRLVKQMLRGHAETMISMLGRRRSHQEKRKPK
jgi:hypothetical protein